MSKTICQNGSVIKGCGHGIDKSPQRVTFIPGTGACSKQRGEHFSKMSHSLAFCSCNVAGL